MPTPDHMIELTRLSDDALETRIIDTLLEAQRRPSMRSTLRTILPSVVQEMKAEDLASTGLSPETIADVYDGDLPTPVREVA